MKIRTALLLVPVLLVFFAGTATAKVTATHGGLDTGYGRGGTTTVAVQGGYKSEDFAVAEGGKAYALRGSLLLAFDAKGGVAHDFGKNGRVTVKLAAEGEPVALAIDSQGRILVVGNTSSPFVIRYLPDGSRDTSFGNDGEVDTDFALPIAAGEPGAPRHPGSGATAIAVDSQDRPVIGGVFESEAESLCGYVRSPFVARLTISGALDTTFGGRGYALPAGSGEVTALGQTPGGEVATLSRGFFCGPRTSEEPSRLSVFTETGAASPGLDPARPAFTMTRALAIDPRGRILVLQAPAEMSKEPFVLVRLQADGDLDKSFGHQGGVALTGGLKVATAITVDAKSRPIIAMQGSKIELRRLTANGKIDMGFGPKGRLTAKGGAPSAVALDGRGRIYTASVVKDPSLKTGYGIEVARFIPGS
jgi:uncharacterized delta-60 repeat protein